MNTARLVLEDGSIWHGKAFGALGTRLGEVVFNTSMTGYQEILTDPSYAGQIVVMTASQIGNTGINEDDDEARRIFLSGFVIRDYSSVISNWRATKSLAHWLEEQNIISICDVDTRAITRRIRDQGSMKGLITTDQTLSDEEALTEVQQWHGLDGVDLVRTVTCEETYRWIEKTASQWEFRHWQGSTSTENFHVVAYDFGIKYNILRRLAAYGCRITVVPAHTTAAEVIALNPDGILLSNGPGDPSAIPYAVEATRELIGRVPIFGICLGHQILGQALGGKTYRLKFGHHGGNQPVRHIPSKRVEISAHNHNYAVDPKSLPSDVEVTHINLNDGCCEGMRHTTLPVMSVQYHPEAAPGPHDSDPLFDDFIRLISDYKK